MTRSHRSAKAAVILSAGMLAIAVHAGGQAAWAQDRPVSPKSDGEKPPAAKPVVGPRKGIPSPTVVLEPGQVPQVAFETPVYDFGRRRAGEKIAFDFWFKNVGTGPLEILKVKPGCSCTAGGNHDHIVQPNARGRVPIVFDTTRFAGPVAKTVTVHSNAPGEQATTILKIKGDVWQPVEVTPRSIAFGRITMESLATQTPRKKVTIVNNLDAKITPSNLRSSNPAFKPTITPIEDGKKFELEVSIVQPVAAGSNLGDIEFDTGIPETRTVKVRASAYVTAIVDVTPAQLFVSPKRQNDIRRSFYVRNNSSEKITLGDIETSNPALSATITEAREGMTFKVTVLIPAAYDPPPGGDRITIRTSHPRMPTLSIPIAQRAAGKPHTLGSAATPSAKSTQRTAATKIQTDRASGAAAPGS